MNRAEPTKHHIAMWIYRFGVYFCEKSISKIQITNKFQTQKPKLQTGLKFGACVLVFVWDLFFVI
jgi:hypothetical protein